MPVVEAAWGGSQGRPLLFGAGLCPWVYWQLTECLSLPHPQVQRRLQHLCGLRLVCCPQGSLENGGTHAFLG